MDSPDVPGLLPLIRKANLESPLDETRISYFLSTIDLHPGTHPGMSRWRKRLFLRLTAQLTATNAAEYSGPPVPHRRHGRPHRTVTRRPSGTSASWPGLFSSLRVIHGQYRRRIPPLSNLRRFIAVRSREVPHGI